MSKPPDARAVIALLANRDSRIAFSEISLGIVRREPSPRHSRAVRRLREAGLVVGSDEGPEINEQGLRTAIDAYSPPKPTGLARFISDGKIVSYPAAASDRLDVLTWVASQVLAFDERINEATLNERLKPFMDEHVLLRRYLVDYAVVERARDGSWYALPHSASSSP